MDAMLRMQWYKKTSRRRTVANNSIVASGLFQATNLGQAAGGVKLPAPASADALRLKKG